jgi:hypothetical protein
MLEILPRKSRSALGGRAPSGVLVEVQHPDHIGRNGVLHRGNERDQEIDLDFVGLERAYDLDHVDRALRVADQHKRSKLAGSLVLNDHG